MELFIQFNGRTQFAQNEKQSGSRITFLKILLQKCGKFFSVSLYDARLSGSIFLFTYGVKETNGQRQTNRHQEWNFVHFSLKIRHLLAIILMIFLTFCWLKFA